jgi:hypothetical protein
MFLSLPASRPIGQNPRDHTRKVGDAGLADLPWTLLHRDEGLPETRTAQRRDHACVGSTLEPGQDAVIFRHYIKGSQHAGQSSCEQASRLLGTRIRGCLECVGSIVRGKHGRGMRADRLSQGESGPATASSMKEYAYA